jgi:hypothetical protein
MGIYKTFSEIKKHLDANNILTGTIDVRLHNALYDAIGFWDDVCNDLVGEKYGYLVRDIKTYKIVGCDIDKQTIQIEVSVDATNLVDELK